MQILISILPIFFVIGLGHAVRKSGLITNEFLAPANKLVYYVSIPAFLFNAVARGPLHEQFDPRLILGSMGAAAGAYLIAHFSAHLFHLHPERTGTFIQSCAHGNQGYVALPIIYYYIGEHALAGVGIVVGCIMIVQNLFSVFFLQLHSNNNRSKISLPNLFTTLAKNPVILSILSGLLVSGFNITIPEVIHRILDILGGLAPPMSLLLIGASVSLTLMRKHAGNCLASLFIKLFLLPLTGVVIFSLLQIPTEEFLPAVILLAAPTATITYIFAKEMGGDPDFAVAVVSSSTLVSCISYTFWLALLSNNFISQGAL